MRFEKISETCYACHSDSGKTYTLSGRPIADEYESAMRCGIDPDDEFVQCIPLVWTCDCPAGQYGRDCKHARALLRERGNNVPTEEEHATHVRSQRIAREQEAKRAKALAAQAAETQERDRAAYLAARDNPECRQMAANLMLLDSHGQPFAMTDDRVLITQFEERWGFVAHETRIERLAGKR